MNIFEAYEQYSHKIIKEDEVLSKYETDIREKSHYVRNLLINTDDITLVMHPIKLIRTRQEAKRLKAIGKGYYDLKKSPLIEHFDEESGELDHDLRSAAEYFKPNRMRLYTKLYPVYREEEDSKMLRSKSR